MPSSLTQADGDGAMLDELLDEVMATAISPEALRTATEDYMEGELLLMRGGWFGAAEGANTSRSITLQSVGGSVGRGRLLRG